jgi:hypothetical protein
LFAALASATVVVPLLGWALGGDAVQQRVGSWRDRVLGKHGVVMAVMMGVLGLVFVVEGLFGL